MEEKRHLIIICGEASGDLHAGNLAKAIKAINPRVRISGVGGALLREASEEIYCDIQDLTVLGLFDVLRKLPKFFQLKTLLLQKIREEKPDAIVFVDFSGFNLRFAKALNNSLKTIYYISPQVWASRPGRVNTIKKYIRRMIVFFKFEEEFYRRYGVKVDFVGHPLLDIVKPTMERKQFLAQAHLSEAKRMIALLPGSRRQEIKNILPVMLGAAKLIHHNLADAQFVIAKSPHVPSDIYSRCISHCDVNVSVVEGKTYDCVQTADFCLVASGTATLETAILGKPFVIIYKMGLLNYLLYRPQVRVPYIGMVNIVAKRKIIPEFVQFAATPKKIAQEVLDILQNSFKIQEIKTALAGVKSLLGESGATQRGARIVLEILEHA